MTSRVVDDRPRIRGCECRAHWRKIHHFPAISASDCPVSPTHTDDHARGITLAYSLALALCRWKKAHRGRGPGSDNGGLCRSSVRVVCARHLFPGCATSADQANRPVLIAHVTTASQWGRFKRACRPFQALEQTSPGRPGRRSLTRVSGPPLRRAWHFNRCCLAAALFAASQFSVT
jgi:hypothetical protein